MYNKKDTPQARSCKGQRPYVWVGILKTHLITGLRNSTGEKPCMGFRASYTHVTQVNVQGIQSNKKEIPHHESFI